jgi:tetraacyldisaccharide 4'-kinase
MLRRVPDFWRADGLAARLLAPAGALYGAVAARRLARPAPRGPLPAIVIGGLTAGGDGKTPLALALAAQLAAQGETPAFLTRGYGARRRDDAAPLVVGASATSDRVGDEALLLARQALTIVGADRAAGARLARDHGASVVLLDDGFHSRRLAPDLALLVIDAAYGAGNGRCLPAGPLRAPLAAQIGAADALVVIGDAAAGAALAAGARKPVFCARFAAAPGAGLAGARVVAFAGIGRPEKFFATLRESGANIVAERRFADHHPFRPQEIAALAALAGRLDARLVTTEKDAMRLPPGAGDIDVLPVRLDIDAAAALAETIACALRRARALSPAS